MRKRTAKAHRPQLLVFIINNSNNHNGNNNNNNNENNDDDDDDVKYVMWRDVAKVLLSCTNWQKSNYPGR